MHVVFPRDKWSVEMAGRTCLEPWLSPTWLTVVLSPSEFCLKGGLNSFEADAELEVSLVMVHWFRFDLSGSEVLFKLPTIWLVLEASLWALLSRAFRLFSSIFLCCSAVKWLDMMNWLRLNLTSYSFPAMEQIIYVDGHRRCNGYGKESESWHASMLKSANAASWYSPKHSHKLTRHL